MRKTWLLATTLMLLAANAFAQTKPAVLPVWASGAAPTTDIVQPGNSYITSGWPLSSTPPSRQYFNWLDNYEFNGIRYLSRYGLPEYDPAETYNHVSVVNNGADGLIYQSLTDNNIGNSPVSAPTLWGPLRTKTAANGDSSSFVATTAFVHNNYIPIGCAFNCIAGQIASAQVPFASVQQYQASLSISWNQINGAPLTTNPTPNTIAVRDASGYLHANYFQGTTLSDTSAGVTQIYFGSGDGYIRPGPVSFVEAQMNLAAIGGQVSAGQVPQNAVTQYSPAIFNYNPLISKSVPGYVELPGGIIEEWGQAVVANNTNTTIDINITFPVAFPNNVFMVIPVTQRSVASNGQSANGANHATNLSRTGATITCDSSGNSQTICRWFAIGF